MIGGGIHGVTAALALASDGLSVAIIERLPRLLAGTSAATHNRAHLGFHYPRCDRTANECRRGLEYFASRYPEALYDPGESYYLIERNSKVSGEQYARFCDRLELPYKRQWPAQNWLKRDCLVDSFLTHEPCFDLAALTQALMDEVANHNVRLLTGWTLNCVTNNGHGEHRVTATDGRDVETLPADIVINATYALSNNVLEAAGLEADRTKYSYHTTEVVVARYPGPRLPAVTVMDGPFISVMPLAGTTDRVLVYDVENSVHRRMDGYSYEAPSVDGSNWKKMREHGRRYLAFMDDLEYVDSLWGSRPTRFGRKDDSRHTRIVSHRASPGFFSILEGKFISAPLVADSLMRLIRAVPR